VARLEELSQRASALDQVDMRISGAAGVLQALSTKAQQFLPYGHEEPKQSPSGQILVRAT
jgi:hypothetical protein